MRTPDLVGPGPINLHRPPAIQAGRGASVAPPAANPATQSAPPATNNAAVPEQVAAAVGQLNTAINQATLLDSSSPQASREIEAAIRAALALIQSAGVGGIAASKGARLQLELSSAKFAEAAERAYKALESPQP